MNSYQKRTLQAFRRMQGWLVVHPELDAVVNDLTAFSGEQETQDRAARGAAAEISRLRNELIVHQMRHLAIIAETAMPDVVKMTVALQRPARHDAEGVISAAEAMAKAAVQYMELLVQRGLPTDFIDQLRNAAAAYKQAIDSRGAAVGRRHRAGEALQTVVQRGTRVVDALSVLVARRYRDDSATLAEWKQVRRVTIVGVRSAAADAEVKSVPAAVQPAPLLAQQAAA